MKKKVDTVKENRRAARIVIGKPSKGKKTGPHTDHYKEDNKNKCREDIDEEDLDSKEVL